MRHAEGEPPNHPRRRHDVGADPADRARFADHVPHLATEHARAPAAGTAGRKHHARGRARLRGRNNGRRARLAAAVCLHRGGDAVEVVDGSPGRLRLPKAHREVGPRRSGTRSDDDPQQHRVPGLRGVGQRRIAPIPATAISAATRHRISPASLPRPPGRGTFTPSRAISSAGRAPSRQGGGRWFEPSIAHQVLCRGFVGWGRFGLLGSAHTLRTTRLAVGVPDRLGCRDAGLVFELLGHAGVVLGKRGDAVSGPVGDELRGPPRSIGGNVVTRRRPLRWVVTEQGSLIETSTTKDKTCRPNRGRSRASVRHRSR
jgi:hypothetical protein